MDIGEFPNRKDKYRNKWKDGPPTIALALGSLWIFSGIIPYQWKSVWVFFLILILTLFTTNQFDKIKMPPLLKWGISLSVYGVGLVIFVTNH